MKVAIVLPLYNEEENIEPLCVEIDRVLVENARTGISGSEEGEFDLNLLFILVDDCSSDQSADRIREMKLSKHSSKRIVQHARNFGQQSAIMSGLSHVPEDFKYIVVMDSDFQDNPVDIALLLKPLSEGFDCTYAIRKPESGKLRIDVATRMFYFIQNKVTIPRIPKYAGSFSAFTREFKDKLLLFKETEVFFPGIRAFVGMKQKAIPVKRGARKYGAPKVNLFTLINLSLDGILGFSALPMRLILYFGLTLTLFCLFLGMVVITLRLIGVIEVLGFTSLALFILGLFGVQFILIGLLGEYVGKLFLEVKQRPRSIIAKVIDD